MRTVNFKPLKPGIERALGCVGVFLVHRVNLVTRHGECRAGDTATIGDI